jgi:hypothetical protein
MRLPWLFDIPPVRGYTLLIVAYPDYHPHRQHVKMFRRLLRSSLIPIIAILAASGCTAPGTIGLSTAGSPIPTFDPALLSVTAAPSATPLPTYTPYPTEPIVQIIDDSHARCGGWILMQLGVINWGNMPAKKFTVQWSAGVPIESNTTRIDDLEWGALPYYFRNKEVQFPCDETTTFTAWVRVDTLNEVPEIYEDNNYKELTFTVPYYPPTRPP